MPPRLAPGGSPSLLQRVQPSLSVSPEHSLLATNRIKRSGSPHNCLPPETVRTRPRKGKMTKEKREAWFPPTQTAQWPGEEAWFSGHPGHPDTIQADTPRVRIWLSLPYLLLHKELSRTGSHLTLQFSEALGCAHTWLGTEMRAPAPCLLTPTPAGGPRRSAKPSQAARRTEEAVRAGPAGALPKPLLPMVAPANRPEPKSASAGCQSPRTTRVACGPPSKELADPRRGQPSSRAKTETGGSQDPATRREGTSAAGGGGGGEQRRADEGEGAGGGVHSGGQPAARSDASGLQRARLPSLPRPGPYLTLVRPLRSVHLLDMSVQVIRPGKERPRETLEQDLQGTGAASLARPPPYPCTTKESQLAALAPEAQASVARFSLEGEGNELSVCL